MTKSSESQEDMPKNSVMRARTWTTPLVIPHMTSSSQTLIRSLTLSGSAVHVSTLFIHATSGYTPGSPTVLPIRSLKSSYLKFTILQDSRFTALQVSHSMSSDQHLYSHNPNPLSAFSCRNDLWLFPGLSFFSFLFHNCCQDRSRLCIIITTSSPA